MIVIEPPPQPDKTYILVSDQSAMMFYDPVLCITEAGRLEPNAGFVIIEVYPDVGCSVLLQRNVRF